MLANNVKLYYKNLSLFINYKTIDRRKIDNEPTPNKFLS